MADENEFGVAEEISESELGGDINVVVDVDETDEVDAIAEIDPLPDVDGEEEVTDEEDPFAEIATILDPNETNMWDDR